MIKPVKAILFDFGGVIAEEGFREGIKAVGRLNGLEPEAFFRLADDLIYETEYVTGKAGEADFWGVLRERSGIRQSDSELREEVLRRFTLRADVLELVDGVRNLGLTVAILSDQTNWLDELDQKNPFYHRFDLVFNSYKTGKGKRDPSFFRDVCRALGVAPDEALFIDDNLKNIERARGEGLRTIHFRSVPELRLALKTHLPGL